MSITFDRAQNDSRNFEQSSSFEQYFSRYDLEYSNFSKPQRFNSKIPFAGLGGIPLSWDTERGHVYAECSDAHTLVIGPTASKKSRLITMPTVRMLGSAKESMIISDPKSEIYNRTAGSLKSEGYRIQILNLRDSNYGSSWNPLEIPYAFYCQGDIDRAYEFVNDIATNLTAMNKSKNDPFWDNSAGSLFFGLTALLFRYCHEFSESRSVVHIGSILHLRNILCTGSKNTIMQNPLWQYAKSDQNIASALIGTLETADDTRAGIISVFDQKMRIFSTQPNLTNMLSTNEITFDEIDQKPTALFLILPDEKTTYHGLVSLFIKQSYEYIIFKAQQRNKNHDAKLQIRLNYVLDEFSSLPTINDFPAMITAARSRNIRFNIVIQSKHQLVLRYAEDTDTILSNCTNWIFLTSRELKFLEEISLLCGQINNSETKKPVLSVAELQRLDKMRGEALILSGRFKPYLTRLPDIEMYDNNKLPKSSMQMRKINSTDILSVNMQKVIEIIKQNGDGVFQRDLMTPRQSMPFNINQETMRSIIPIIDDRIERMLQTSNHSVNPILAQLGLPNNVPVDEIITAIDKKITKLEAEEKNESKIVAKDEKSINDSLPLSEIDDTQSLFNDEFDKAMEELENL